HNFINFYVNLSQRPEFKWFVQQKTKANMKSSASLTSLSSMDKESSLNFYGHYGFNSTLSQQRSSFSNLSSAPTLNNNNKLQDDFRRKFTEEQDELPRLSNKKRQKRNDLITVNLSGTRYEV
ncbi:Tubulin polyglutamylase ttll7, partial [Biomphalaria glabrata]